jgi:hypothetical protein
MDPNQRSFDRAVLPRPSVAQNLLDSGQALIDSSMVHIKLKTANEIDEFAQRVGESGQGD